MVEGESEKDLLDGVTRRFYLDRPAIQVVSVKGDHDRIYSNMEALNLVFKPLYGNAVYRNRLIVLCDAPSPEKQESFRRFKSQNDSLIKRKQFFVLPVNQIESYYPSEWKTDEKLKSHQKRNLAKRVANDITQADFELKMPLVFDALNRCWANAHKVESE